MSLWGERGDEPVLSHEEPGATDHSSVEWEVVFDRILSVLGLRFYVLFSHSFYLIMLKICCLLSKHNSQLFTNV